MTGGTTPLVTHVIHRLDFGGLENGLVNLVNCIPPARYRHAIVCLAGFNEAFRGRIRRSDVRVISLDKKPGKDFGAYGRMWRTLRVLRPDILHTRNLGTLDMQWVAAAAGVRHRVHGEHGWEASDPTGRNSWHRRIRRSCDPVIDRYVPMSQDIARWLRDEIGVSSAKIRQLYSGVDTERFKPHSQPIADLAREGAHRDSDVGRRRAEGSLTIGTVGRLDPVKNHALLLQSFASLLDEFKQLRLVVVGDGPLRRDLEALATSLGIRQLVQFTGARNDTPALMQSFDIFALPSINEGISNTILEAMATGLPVVAAKVGGNPEIVADCATGRLYDPADPDGLRQALLPYLTSRALRETHGRAARSRIVQNFSVDAMVQRYLDLYDELMTTGPPLHLSPDSAAQGDRRPGEGS